MRDGRQFDHPTAAVSYTAGDPSLALTRRFVIEAARRGADLVELGVPFSDPIADGPVIQRGEFPVTLLKGDVGR